MQQTAINGYFIAIKWIFQSQMLKSVSHQTMRGIIRRYTHFYPIPLNYLDPVFFHSTGKDAHDDDIINTFDLHGPTAHDLCNYTLDFD